jgi:hypothetical protein
MANMSTRKRQILFLALLSLFSLGLYLLVSDGLIGIGFPLDDAWIHQTYARSLAQRGEWSFLPGQPSAGSTAPLWSALISIAYLLNDQAYTWTFTLGGLSLLGVAISGAWYAGLLSPNRKQFYIWAAVFLMLEWHLVWAALSGMETLFFAFLVLLTFGWLLSENRNWLGIGLLIGISVWVRPDGITLLAPAVLSSFFVEDQWRRRISSIIYLCLGVVFFVLSYAAFNSSLFGTYLPNTFFAKQAEYSIYQQIPIIHRFIDQAKLPLVGAGALLLPGFVLYLIRAFRKRHIPALIGALWLLGYISLYALRLPVTYQHGRYIIPAMPIYFCYGLVGTLDCLDCSSITAWKRMISKVWLFSIILVWLAFWVMGARAYAIDVAVIETEMVTTAEWISEHLEPNTTLAAHDIGALGFFTNNKIIDLAGLVSPEVIPFVRDEGVLSAYLDQMNVDYLMTFTDWYPNLIEGKEMIYITASKFSQELGAENIAIYRWSSP